MIHSKLHNKLIKAQIFFCGWCCCNFVMEILRCFSYLFKTCFKESKSMSTGAKSSTSSNESVEVWNRRQCILKVSILALCSRNIQNVKLRLDFVEIWQSYHLSDFTWNQILVNSNGPKMSFLAILETLNFDWW